jgi:DNA-binding CsgD family transcriptional regulator
VPDREHCCAEGHRDEGAGRGCVPECGDDGERHGEPEQAGSPVEDEAPWVRVPGDQFVDESTCSRLVRGRQAVRRLGGHGLVSLTQRERQVADLVVSRYTNPEIAAALFLSPKTVETHLRHIFHKLDVTSRVELARTVEATPQGET